MITITRDENLQERIDRMDNGMIKVISGIQSQKTYYFILLQFDGWMNMIYHGPDTVYQFKHKQII